MINAKTILRQVSFEDVENILAFANIYCKELNDYELLTDAAESLKIAIELQDVEMIEKARKQLIHFFFADKSNLTEEPLWDVIRTEENAKYLISK